MSVIGPYFDEALDSAFNFDLADRLLSAASSERDPDIAFSLGRAHSFYGQSSGNEYVDAPFLSNHDQNRVMTVLNGNVNQAKTAASLLLTLPGTPFIYYGEEIGLQGAKPDEYIREPMLWYADPAGGKGQTTWITSRHNREAGAASVEAQQQDEDSLLNHYRKLISWRNSEPALQNGAIAEYKRLAVKEEEVPDSKPSDTTNEQAANSAGNQLGRDISKLSAYLRVISDDRLLIVHNLSGQAQQVMLEEDPMYGTFEQLILASDELAVLEGEVLTIPPYSTVAIR